MNLSKHSSLDALKMATIGELFPRYSRIILNGVPPKFQIAKRIIVKFDRDMDLKEMLKEHSNLMEKFRETEKMIDKNKLDINELEVPRFSLMDLKIEIVKEMIESCNLCEHSCGIDRKSGEIGQCRCENTELCRMASEGIHLGEESHIIPSHTIFLTGCNFDCQYCQNWKISQKSSGYREIHPRMLSDIIRKREGDSRNVNWVGGEPTPHTLSILETLRISDTGLPQIWNSNFYMGRTTMAMLDGIIDMYLSDFKYGNNTCAKTFSKIDDYFEIVARNHLLAVEQAELTVRHLVLPDHVECCTKPVLKWISDNIRTNCMVNVMDQYHPSYKSKEYLNLKRGVDKKEIHEALNYAETLNLFYTC